MPASPLQCCVTGLGPARIDEECVGQRELLDINRVATVKSLGGRMNDLSLTMWIDANRRDCGVATLNAFNKLRIDTLVSQKREKRVGG